MSDLKTIPSHSEFVKIIEKNSFASLAHPTFTSDTFFFKIMIRRKAVYKLLDLMFTKLMSNTVFQESILKLSNLNIFSEVDLISEIFY